MTDIILEVEDKSKKIIRLTKKQWSHIRQDHPNVENDFDIKDTIKNSIKTLYLEKEKTVYFRYFKHRKDPEKYLKVIAKYLNGDGFIVTAYFVKTIK